MTPLRAVTDADWKQWDRLVQESPHGTFFHTSCWLKALRHHMGQNVEAHLLEDESGNVLAGVTFLRKSAPFFNWATKPWATHYSGMILAAGLSSEEQSAAVFLVHDHLHRRFHHLQLVQNMPPPLLGPMIDHGWSVSTRTTLMVDASDIEGLWTRLAKQTRTNIRSAERHGITVETKNDPALLYSLYRKSYARQGASLAFSPQSWDAFMSALLTAGNAEIIVAFTREGRPGNALLLGTDSRRAYVVLAGTDAEVGRHQGGELLWWEAVRRSAARYAEVDLVGVGTPGIEKFKRHFRPRDVPFAEAVWWRSPLRKVQFALMRAARSVVRR